MKSSLVLSAVLLILVPLTANADLLGFYSDATGSSCSIQPGFSTTTAVVHKFSLGATASRFKMSFPPGSNVFQFNSAYTVQGDLQTGIQVMYGGCLQGSWAVGTVVAIFAPGTICMLPANGFSEVTATDCLAVENDATRSGAVVGFCDGYSGGPGCYPLAVESSTWGAVKSLYR